MVLIKLREAGKRLGVSYRTIWGWVKTGRLPAVRIAEKIIRVSETEVEKLKSRFEINEGKIVEPDMEQLPGKPEDPIDIV